MSGPDIEGEIIEHGSLPHDGVKSRRWRGSAAAAAFLALLASVLLVWSGRYSELAWFGSDVWLYSIIVAATVLSIGWGLMTVDKVLELLRIIKGDKR